MSGSIFRSIVRRRVFLSFYQGNRPAVDSFIREFDDQGGVMSARALGVSDNDDFINSTNTAYVMQKIREKYIQNASVTIVLIGPCTHSRRYVDWEIKASLTQGGDSLPNGLLGIRLPSTTRSTSIPERLRVNRHDPITGGYAKVYDYPAGPHTLRGWIEDAISARTARSASITNYQDTWKQNRKCDVCGWTH